MRQAIYAAYEADPALKDQIPRKEAFRMLLHRGLIQEFRNVRKESGGPGAVFSRYDCPIPSLRTCIQDFCAQEGFPVQGAAAGAEEEDVSEAAPAP